MTMTPRPVLTAARARALLAYDQDTGDLTRRVASSTAKVGDRAGWRNARGYLQVRVDGTVFQASHIVHLHVTGRWPVTDLAHLNSVRDDDRFCNLQNAVRSQAGRGAPRKAVTP